MPCLSKDRHPRRDVAEIEGVLEARHGIASLGSDSLHHAQFLGIACEEIQEREFVEVLRLLVRGLKYLSISDTVQTVQCELTA